MVIAHQGFRHYTPFGMHFDAASLKEYPPLAYLFRHIFQQEIVLNFR
jgi:hypothetical protein